MVTGCAIYRKFNFHSWLEMAMRRGGKQLHRFLAECWKRFMCWKNPLATRAIRLTGKIVSETLRCSPRTGRRLLLLARNVGAFRWVGTADDGVRLYAPVHPDLWAQPDSVLHASGHFCPHSSFIGTELRSSETEHSRELTREPRESSTSVPSRFSEREVPSHRRDLPDDHRESESIPDPTGTPCNSEPRRADNQGLEGSPVGPERGPCSSEAASTDKGALEEHHDSESFRGTHRRFFKQAMQSASFPYEAPSNPEQRAAERMKVAARLRALEKRGTTRGDLVRVLEHVAERAKSLSYSGELLATHKILLPKHFDRELEYLRKQQQIAGTSRKRWEPSGTYTPPASEVLRTHYSKEQEQAREEKKRPGGLKTMISSTVKSILSGGSFSGGIR